MDSGGASETDGGDARPDCYASTVLAFATKACAAGDSVRSAL